MPALFDRAMRESVDVIPDEVHRTRHLPEHRRVLVFNANFERLGGGGLAHACVLIQPAAASKDAHGVRAILPALKLRDGV